MELAPKLVRSRPCA